MKQPRLPKETGLEKNRKTALFLTESALPEAVVCAKIRSKPMVSARLPVACRKPAIFRTRIFIPSPLRSKIWVRLR
jgi:hypothetical protein